MTTEQSTKYNFIPHTTGEAISVLPPPSRQSQQQQIDDETKILILNRLKAWSTIAGGLYLIIIICGLYAELAVRSSMIDFTSPYQTSSNIASHPLKFKSALVADLTMCSSDIAVAVLLGAILIHAGADVVLTLVSTAFRLLQTAVIAGNLMHMFAASLLVDPTLPTAGIVMSASSALYNVKGGNGEGNGNENGGGGGEEGSIGDEIAFLFLLMHKYGYLLAPVFFGISLLLLGVIIVRWCIFPPALGWIIGLGGVCYIIDSMKFFLEAGYDGGWSGLLMIPPSIAEIAFTAYLLFGSPSLSN